MIRQPPSSARFTACSHLLSGSLLAIILGLPAVAPAQLPDLAAAEVQRRADLVAAEQTRVDEAFVLLKAGKNQEALVIFRETYVALPDVPMAKELRDRALAGYVTAGLNRAGELAATGDLKGARALLEELDSPAAAPGHKGVARLKARLGDPDRFPPALTAQHVDRVAEVKRLLTLANSQREIGNYDQALLTFEEVLRLDPYNSAARRGMETTERERMRYLETARDQRRASMLSEVDKQWENPPIRADISDLFGSGPQLGATGVPRGDRAAISRKLRELMIERVDFSGASVEEVVEYLRVRSRDIDPEGRGIDFVISLPPDAPPRLITLNVSNVPIEEVLRYVGQIAGLRHRVEDYAVRLVSIAEASDDIVTKTYRVPPDFISTAAVDAGAAAPADPFAQVSTAATNAMGVRRLGAREFLESRGVTFPAGTSANYSPGTNVLIVRNTARNIEIIDTMVEQAIGSAPKQVVVEVRALDVGQDNLKELGFDWLLGGFNLDNTQLAGGTTGNQQPANFLTQAFPNQVGGVPVGANPVTAGLRSSGDLISNQQIEDVLYGAVTPAGRRSPGVFSLTGVLTDPQFQTVIRALDQKKGIDLLVKPSVVTKSGQRASVQVVREMLYPTEFDPPQIPTSFATPPPVIIIGQPLIPPPTVVTPATPTAFEMRRVGVVLDVEPVVSEDGRSVELTLTPEITDFVGFINYGSPIRSVSRDGNDVVELTENRIFQPIFSTRKVATSVRVWDGATVVLGGLISDNSIMIEDRVPVLGDVPVVGRMFRSSVKQRRVRNMLIFVTARVIDPSGSRIHPEAN